ncbi:MAG: carbamoyltransferase HypF [Deltaproteobacteria bacterium]|nr:carbamoyltransferase HypF [Deltaproteobacteria bacterium]
MRRRVVLRGVTQGVGFRPTVYRYARGFAVTGFVRNDSDGVTIEVEGEPCEVSRFEEGLAGAIPPLSRIDSREAADVPPAGGESFAIEASSEPRGGVPPIPADIATCPECFSELSDPQNRRSGYPFITCTLCGPRFTIVRSSPYDRERTSMKPFSMCPECAREYAEPGDRRFHSETNSCETCGPRLALLDPGGGTVGAGHAAVEAAAEKIAQGGIVAVKGMGGFHLACDARNESAIDELRRRKGRAEKPFAVMVRDVEAAGKVAALTEEDKRLLLSPVAPIIIATRVATCDLPVSIAPGNPTIGVFIAYTPLHRLLFDAVPPHASSLMPHAFVMTSGNRSDEPIAIGNDEALSRLDGIADAFLVHDREIVCRADDSILRRLGGRAVVFRRSRGIVPEGIKVHVPGPDVLALGGELKNTVAVLAGEFVYPSPHIGDLETAEAHDHFRASIEMMQEFTGCRPDVIACDMHPEYLSTKFALDLEGKEADLGGSRTPLRAAPHQALFCASMGNESGAALREARPPPKAQEKLRQDVRVIQVQHHHAHVAACMVEHGLLGPVIGVSFDGTGYGPDGTVWGGEFLVADYGGFKRAGTLKPVPMPGGAKAIREPFRMATGFLSGMAGTPPERVLANMGMTEAEFVTYSAIARQAEFSPLTSSAGRLFDAVAAIAGIARLSTFEGQAAMALEAAAARADGRDDSYPCVVNRVDGRMVVDTPLLVAQIAEDVSSGVRPEVIARKFHDSLAAAVLAVCIAIRGDTGLESVVLTGGVFQNAIMTELCENALRGTGFSVYRHARIPPNDGGISVGQAVVAREVVRCASRYRCEL